jgi:Bifunctional DNA primase/polymerase, N-terminal
MSVNAEAPSSELGTSNENDQPTTATEANTTAPGGMYLPLLADGASNYEWATALADAGVYILPVKPGTKHPGSRVGDNWQSKSSRDPQTIAMWYAGNSDGIAIDLGRSGLAAIDVDHPDLVPDWLIEALRTAAGPYQSTRPDGGGRGHYLFRQPSGRHIGCRKGGLADMGLDVKADGGVIISQPTVHPEGGEYRWVRGGSIPVLPAVIAEKLVDVSGDAQSAATDSEVRAFIDSHTSNTKPALLSAWANRFESDTAKLGSRHAAMVSVLTAALEEVRCGYFPASATVDHLRAVFVKAMTA